MLTIYENEAELQAELSYAVELDAVVAFYEAFATALDELTIYTREI